MYVYGLSICHKLNYRIVPSLTLKEQLSNIINYYRINIEWKFSVLQNSYAPSPTVAWTFCQATAALCIQERCCQFRRNMDIKLEVFFYPQVFERSLPKQIVFIEISWSQLFNHAFPKLLTHNQYWLISHKRCGDFSNNVNILWVYITRFAVLRM
mgnify:CR=1 FL=1